MKGGKEKAFEMRLGACKVSGPEDKVREIAAAVAGRAELLLDGAEIKSQLGDARAELAELRSREDKLVGLIHHMIERF